MFGLHFNTLTVSQNFLPFADTGQALQLVPTLPRICARPRCKCSPTCHFQWWPWCVPQSCVRRSWPGNSTSSLSKPNSASPRRWVSWSGYGEVTDWGRGRRQCHVWWSLHWFQQVWRNLRLKRRKTSTCSWLHFIRYVGRVNFWCSFICCLFMLIAIWGLIMIGAQQLHHESHWTVSGPVTLHIFWVDAVAYNLQRLRLHKWTHLCLDFVSNAAFWGKVWVMKYCGLESFCPCLVYKTQRRWTAW